MSLNYTRISGQFLDGQGNPLSGTLAFTPNVTVYASGIPVLQPDVPVQAQITGGELKNLNGSALQLLATDNAGLSYEGQTGFFFWSVSITVGANPLDPWQFFLPYDSLGAGPVDLWSLANTAAGGASAVSSVFGRTGAVAAVSGDYSAAQVTGAAPLASPVFTGTPTAPTQTTGDSTTKIATDAFVAAAVGLETARAEAAEAELVPLSDLPLSIGDGGTGATSAPSARTALGLGSAATQPSSAFDAAGAASAALASAETYAAAVAATAQGNAEAASFPLQPWQIQVGAPSGVDDTAAVLAAIRAAVTYATAHSYYAEVIFGAGVYLLNTGPSGGLSGDCNAILPLDPVAGSGQKLILVLRGSRRQSALYYWLQTTPQLAGTTLRTTYAAGTSPTTGNEPSMIGGPTPHGGYGEGSGIFSNMHLVVDGIGLVAPQNPEVSGFDFRGIGEVTVVSASVLASSTGTGAPARPDDSSGLWATGILMPQTGNNDLCDIGEYSCEGFPVGLWADEHLAAGSVRLIGCYDGLLIQPAGGAPHSNRLGYLSIENCFRCVVFAGGDTAKAVIDLMDIEWDPSEGGAIVDVVGGTLALGSVNVSANGSSGATLSAAMSAGMNANSATGGLRVINADMATGPWSGAPSVPATGTAQLNTAWRDATVYITSGGAAVTAIKVDSAVTGLTLGTAGTVAVRVPSGHSITLTYALTAPTWAWVLD